MKEEDQDKPGYDEDENHSDNMRSDNPTVQNTKLLFDSLSTEKLSPVEKEQIWNRIAQYVHPQDSQDEIKSIRPWFWYKIAAVLAVFLFVGVGYKMFKNNEAVKMQQIAEDALFKLEDTRLVLADSRTIELKGDHSDVVYDNEVIRVDSATIAKNIGQPQQDGLNTLIVPYGKRSVITLSDGTKIWLNSGSKLVYPSEFAPGKREVHLEGQAYFSVAHDAQNPFYVKTETMNVKVLGTEFDISSYRDDKTSSAVLVKGSVELETNKDAFWGVEKNMMVPGTRAVINDESSKVELKKVNVSQYTSWKDGYLILDRDPLHEVLKKLSRYYRYDLSLKNDELGRQTSSGTLDLPENIEQVIKVVVDAYSLDYQRSERRFIFEKSTLPE